jgi:hypothetical protein
MKNIFKTKQCKIISLLLGTIGIITPISFTTTSCSQTKIELGSLDNKVLTPQFLFYAHDPSKVTGQELQNMNSSLNLELAIQNEIKQATGVTVDFSDFFLQNLGVPGSNYDGGPDGLEFHSILFVIHASSNSKILTGQRQFTALARATAVMPYDISLASAYLRNDIHVLCTDTEDPHLVDKEHIIKDVNNSSILQRSIIDAINKGSGKHISNEDYDLVFLTNLPDKPIDVSEFMPIQIQIVSKSDNKNMIAGKMQTEILFKVIKNSLPDISSLPHSFTDTLVISSLTPTFVSSDDIVQLQIKIDTFISDTIFAAFQNRFTNQYS